MKYIIKHRFISLNQYIAKERSNRYVAAKIKKDETNIAYYSLKGKEKIAIPSKLRFIWHVKDKRTDLDNIAFGKKFILDGFVKAGLIVDDSLKYIYGFVDEIVIDKMEYVEIETIEGEQNGI